MRSIIVTLLLGLGLMGCGGGDSSDAPLPARQTDIPYSPYNAVTGASPRYQAAQILTPPSQQRVTSRRYVMTVAMF